jgi:predicted  nucleic acid-binding Zn-ribbon protein
MDDSKSDVEVVQRDPEELRKALEECEVRVRELKEQKKALNKTYSDQIKDIDEEIGGILEQLSVYT